MSTVIRDRTAKIEYAIGLNDATVRQFMKDWPKPAAKQLALAPLENGSVSDASGKSALAVNNPIDLPEGELINDVKLIEQFGLIAAPEIAAGLHWTFSNPDDPDAVLPNPELILVSATASPRHHVTLQITWTIKLRAMQKMRIEMVDSNFPDQPGGVRYAFKTAGSAMLVQSNVEPILIRADRMTLATLSETQRLHACRIVATVQFFEVPDRPHPTANP